uniref:Uncharacterized protein n=1 Tax=Siphoviridae sp. ctKNZ79 TaxID=2825440 RepID=A0A8S5U9I8_9CAUD|nr:MAG TPA: hypothetical protein [Siphoviridae sp. ctKNZ79]
MRLCISGLHDTNNLNKVYISIHRAYALTNT